MINVNPQFSNNSSPTGPNSGQLINTTNNRVEDDSRGTRVDALFRNPQSLGTDASVVNLERASNIDLLDTHGEYKPLVPVKPKIWFKTIVDFIKQSGLSIKGLCTGLQSQFGSWSKALLRNPTALAACSGIGAAVIAVMSIKNIFHGINIAVGRRPQETMPSLAYLFQGFLQGGLTAALFSNILGSRNPFAVRDGDRLMVPKSLMIGGVVAPALMGLWLKLAEGNTFLNRIPVIGSMLGEVAKMPLGWLKDAFASSNKTVPSAMVPGEATAQAA